ncbi:MAG: type II secretion system F family protein [Planctomycetota bacterium]
MGRDMATRYRRLAALHRAGVPWPTAVDDVLGPEASARARLGAPVHMLLGDVSPLDRALLEAGEATGQLEPTLERLAFRHEALARSRASSLSTLAYPLVLAHVGAVLIAVPDILAGHPWAGLRWSALLAVPVWLLVAFVRGVLGPGRSSSPGAAPQLHWWNAGRVLDADQAALLALADAHDAGLPWTAPRSWPPRPARGDAWPVTCGWERPTSWPVVRLPRRGAQRRRRSAMSS